ncbi:Wzz/FepE/Etk N-terminal domain-containing protein [Comamonadaceae bacterium G21597-S1]|nr:Wzz/FepE/Etk N-terminal domain-containing protein [Comamonadaceae bacterium G21597-S1]
MEELLGQVVSVAKGMWRHRWPALAVSWFIGIIGIVVVLAVPDRYEASARIFVDTQSILKPLMSGLAVQPNVEQQVVMLSRTLISRPNVEKLIRMADLDLGSTSKAEQENLIEKLTKGLQIRNTGRDNLYTLAYQDVNPDRAKRVVQSLVSIFVESSLGATRKDSDAAKKFIDEQIKSYVVKLEEAESRLKEFRLRNMELQGADGQDMAGKAAAIAAQLSQAKLELREAEKARDSAKRQIEEQKSQSSNITSRSILQESAINVSTPELDSRISALKQNLDGLLQRFTERHPDVVNARRLIKDLEEQKKKEMAELRKTAMANPVAPAGPNQSLITQELGRMLAGSEVQVAALGARVGEYETRLRRAQELLKTAPQIEAEFAQLNRDYGIHKKNYEDLVARRESASLSGELEGSSGSVDFRLIDPPRASQKPVAPNRLLLLPLALVAALGAGLGLAFVLSQLRAVFFDARAVRNTIGLPILGVVTLVRSEAARARESRSLKKFGLASSGLLGMFIAAVVVLTVLANRAG